MRTLILVFLVACTTTPLKGPPTEATCPDATNPALTWNNFGYDFACHYCTNCHDSSLKLSQRNGAPLFHDLDTLQGMMIVSDHTDEQAAWGPAAHNSFMPGAGTGGKCPSVLGGELDENCPKPTDEERENLGTFLACEKLRTQDYTDSDAGVSDHCANYTGPH